MKKMIKSLIAAIGVALMMTGSVFAADVAKIGDTNYETLADGVAAAKAGDAIVLLDNATVEGTLAIPAGVTIKSNGKTIDGSIRMLGDLELNGPLTITGGLWVGKSGETLTATLSGDKLTASYFMFQHGTYTIDADIDAVYGYLSFEATFEVNSTIHTTGANGEVLYINGNVTLSDGAVLDSDNSVFVCNDNAVLTLKAGSKVDSNVKITTSGAKVYIDATGMTAGTTANITGTVTNSGNGAIAVVGNDKLEASIVDGKIVLAAKPVAKIGDTNYETLADAVAALKANGGTLKLLADVNESITFNSPAEDAPTEITVDLNGFTVTSAESTLWVSDGYVVTVKDSSDAKTGKIISTNTGGEAIAIARGGKVILDGGTVENVKYSVYIYSSNATGTEEFVMNGGIVTVPNGGNAITIASGKATINGGKILCNKVPNGAGWNTYVYQDGTLVITGGEFLGTIGNYGKTAISGGTFSYPDDPNDGFSEEHLASGYATKVNADGSITVYELPTSLQGTGTAEDPFLINNIDDLKLFRNLVNSGTRYNGQYVKLTADIDLNDEEWTPIGDRNVDQGSFLGTFDGDNHTISNLWISEWTKTGAGFFSKVGLQTEYVSGTVRNLTFNNVTIVSSESYVGVIAQAPSGALIENVHVTVDITISGYGYVGGIVGHGYPTINNSSVVGNTGSTITANYWGAGAILGFAGDYGAKISNATVEGVKIHANYGGAASVAGSPYGAALDGASVKNVEITSNSDYCMGYVSAGGNLSNVTIENVTATANGQPITPADAKASIGDTVYFSLSSAIDAAKAGETVKLLKNVEIGDSILVDKTLVLDLNCKTITSSNNRSIKINTVGNAAEEVVIRNGAVVSTPDGGRCIQLGGDSLKKLELDGVTLKAENGQYTQTITLAETNSTEPLEFVVKNSTVVASDNNGYAVIFFCPVDVTIEESTMSGYAALYFKNAGTANDSKGSEVAITNSHLIGTNVQSGWTFGTISTEADNVTITVSGGSITAQRTKTSTQAIVYCGASDYESTGLIASLDTELILGEGCRILDEYEDMSVQTVAVRAVYAQALENAGYVVQEVEGATDMIQILGLKVAEVNGVNYASLQAAVDAAQADDVITFLCDVEQEDGVVITDKKVKIDLNGKTFTVSNGASTNNRNFKINGASEVVISNGTMVAAGDYNSGAYGTVRTEGAAKVELQDLKLYNYRGNGLNVKACTGTSVTMTDVEIYAQYGGGVEAAGGTIELTDVVVQQKGMYTAPWNSMAISVNGGGTVIVQSGTYSTECLTVEEANNQGTSHGPWVAGVLNSGGTLIINGGMFSNDNFGENSLATYARGAILADTAANIQINGGTFNALKGIVDVQNNLGDASKNPTGEIKGGTFSADPTNDYIKLAEGYQAVKQPDKELWQVGKLPNAEVVNMGPTEVSPDSYFIFNITNGTYTSNHKDPFDLQITLNFIAKDSAEKAAENAYGDYITDFRIKIDGLSAASITADENCYLAGYYAGMWVKVNLKDFVIENGVGYPVISALFPFTYEDICRDVKNFICGIHLSDDVLNANPNLKVSLDLGLAETQDDMLNGTGFVQVGETYDYTADEMRGPVAISGPDYFTTVTGAVAAALETGDYVKLVKDNAGLEGNLEINRDLVLNLGGNTLTANGKTLAIANSVVTITNGTLSAFTKDNVTLAGNSVLTVTDKNVADSFRLSDSHYVSQNMNGTYSIMLKSAFRVFITVVDGEPRIGFFKDCVDNPPTYTIKGATNLETPEWADVDYETATDAAAASELPLHWVKPATGCGFRFFKLLAE